MKKREAVLFLAGALIVASGCVYGYQSYSGSKELDVIRPNVGATVAYVTDVLRYDVHPGEITYAEMFSKTDRALAEIDRREIDLRSAQFPYAAKAVTLALTYMDSAQNVIRAEAAKYRHQYQYASAMADARSAIDRMSSTNPYISGDASNRADAALAKAQQAAHDLGAETANVRAALIQIRSLSQNAASTFGTSDAADEIAKAIQENTERPSPPSSASAPSAG